MAKLEVCTAHLDSVLAAEQGGGSRVELCDNLMEGGTTPSPGMLELVLERTRIPVHVLIRPRGGDFLYSLDEVRMMIRDIQFCRKAGAAGVVIGALTSDGRIDRKITSQLIEAAGNLQVTFHRAIDLADEVMEELEWLCYTPVTRVLTSGQHATAPEGVAVIQEMIANFGEEIIIMPGGGLNELNISEFHAQVGAHEYHATLRSTKISAMKFRREGVPMGVDGYDEYGLKLTDPAKVATFVGVISK